MPRTARPRSAPVGGLSPQAVLIVSGNLSFLNWLTMVPSLACFDDATVSFLFPSGPGGLKDQVLKMQEEEAQGAQLRHGGWTPEGTDSPLPRTPGCSHLPRAAARLSFHLHLGRCRCLGEKGAVDRGPSPAASCPAERQAGRGMQGTHHRPSPGCMARRAVHLALGVLVAWLSVPVVLNLLSPQQVMNVSFNPLRIVNTYGAFGRYAAHWEAG